MENCAFVYITAHTFTTPYALEQQNFMMTKHFVQFVFGLILPTVPTLAQVIVTDVDPDEIYETSGDSCFVDVNNDGVDDLVVAYWRATSGECLIGCTDHVDVRPSSVRVSPMNGSSIATDQAWAQAFDSLDIVDGSAAWQTTGSLVMAALSTDCSGKFGCIPDNRSGHWSGGNWISSPDRFLAVRLAVGGDTLYGWVRGVVPYSAGMIPSFILREYGYNPTPGEAAFAGSTTTVGLIECPIPIINAVWPNPCTTHIFYHEPTGESSWAARILNAEGRELMVVNSKQRSTVATVDIRNLAPGVYFFEVRSEKGRSTQRIIKL